MGAVTEHFNSGEAAIKAVLAGADILLMPEDLDQAVSALQNACETGEIPVSRIDESVIRILETKVKRGLFDGERQNDDPEKVLGSKEHRELAEKFSAN
jgi:beta-N-acetylhexosaminidase